MSSSWDTPMAPSHDSGGGADTTMAPSHAGGGGPADILTSVASALGKIVTVAAGAAGSLGTFTVAVDNNTKALEANATAQGKVADAQKKLDEARAKEELDKSTVAWEKETAAIKARNAAIDAAIAATGTFTGAVDRSTDSMEALDKHITAAPGTMATMTTSLNLLQGAFFSVTAATDAQNKALEDLLKTQNAYTDAVAHTLDTAKGWKDYLAVLSDEYATGAINLLQYKNALVDFSTQLSQDFSGATGKARDAIVALQGAIQRLIDTAGGGPQTPYDASPTGDLNRTFNKP